MSQSLNSTANGHIRAFREVAAFGSSEQAEKKSKPSLSFLSFLSSPKISKRFPLFVIFILCYFYLLRKISKFSPLCLPSPVCSLKYRSNWFPIVFIKDVAEITAKFWWALDLFAYTLCTAQGLRTLALFSSDPVSELAQIVQNVS